MRVFVDYYEVLQISPNADQETVRRVYRIQAQRFHPDNLETGDAEKFRLLADAYEVLSDPRSRASYDAEHRRGRGRAAPEEFAVPPASDPKDEEQRREQILRLLYRKRQAYPDQPSLGLRELESHLGTPKERLEFSLWYLKESGYLTRSDSARHTITLKGVELIDAMNQHPDGPSRLDFGKEVG
jgi:curved DNA-binding protein CbpA